MCVCIRVRACVHMCLRIHACSSVHVCVCMHVCACAHMCEFMNVHVWMHARVHVHMCTPFANPHEHVHTLGMCTPLANPTEHRELAGTSFVSSVWEHVHVYCWGRQESIGLGGKNALTPLAPGCAHQPEVCSCACWGEGWPRRPGACASASTSLTGLHPGYACTKRSWLTQPPGRCIRCRLT